MDERTFWYTNVAFLNRDEVSDCFVEDFMFVCSEDKIVVKFANYLTNYYITDESIFPSSYFMVAGSIRFKDNQQWSRIIPRTLQQSPNNILIY